MADCSRRQFLAHGTGAAVAAALPLAPAWMRGVAEIPAAKAQVLAEGWEYFEGSLDGPWEVWNSSEVAVWSQVELPHCFNHYDGCDPDVPAYRGQGWYRTHVTVANPYPEGRTVLHFSGAGQTTDVFLGEEHLGHHVGGYDEFVVDVTEAAAKLSAAAGVPAKQSASAKEAVGLRLAIRCDNGRDLDRMPSDLSDFTLYGGLYRPVSVVYLPAVSIEAVHVHLAINKSRRAASVEVRGRLYGAGAAAQGLPLAVKLVAPDGKSIASASTEWGAAQPVTDGFASEGNPERVLARFTLDQPRLWSPQRPDLYRCCVTLGVPRGGPADTHEVEERFGVRTLDFPENGPFHLNGERLFLKGTHRHEDHAGYAAAMPADLLRQEMQLIKDMGANFIWLAHYQQQRLVLDLCDELGLMVWEEVPWCRAGVGSETWQAMGRAKLRNMIDQHFNHASVVFWGLGNEDDWPGEYPAVDQGAIRGYMQGLQELVHKLDGSRYTSYRRCDFARDIPDVYSPSIWAGWYSGLYTEYQKSLETQRPRVKRMMHIEWGADSHAGRHAEDPDRALAAVVTGKGTDERGLAYLKSGGEARVSRDGDWSETYACNLFDWHLNVQETLPWLAGSAQWIFKDFTRPLRVENPVPRVNQKGLIELDMTLKEAYYVFQSYWSEVPMVRLYGHTWPVRWGRADAPKMVQVYSNCVEVELFLNGTSMGVRRRDSQDFPCAGLRWVVPFRPGKNELRAVAKRAGGPAIHDAIEFHYQTEAWSSPARLVVKEMARTADVVTVQALLVDQHGVMCLDARNRVRFTLAGAGRLIDNQGTSRGSRVVEMTNGRAQISVMMMGEATVGVSTEGVPSAFCDVGTEKTIALRRALKDVEAQARET